MSYLRLLSLKESVSSKCIRVGRYFGKVMLKVKKCVVFLCTISQVCSKPSPEVGGNGFTFSKVLLLSRVRSAENSVMYSKFTVQVDDS